MTLRAQAVGGTDVGMVRTDNEDTFLIDQDNGFFAVADGMGGHAAGEVASKISIEALQETLTSANEASAADLMYSGYNLANTRIRDEVAADPTRHGMGTTLVAARIDGSAALIANVGDSRAYLIRGNKMRQVTTDHSWVMEQVHSGRMDEATAATHPYRNVITRALGSKEDVNVDLFEQTLDPKDRLLLCSDGLTGMLTDAQILFIFKEESKNADVVTRLISEANAAGGEDNITAVVLEYS